jgi:hypothetical protein
MPKNIKGGKKSKSLKNSSAPNNSREIPFPEDDDDSHVAIITKVQGDSRYLCQIVNENGIDPNIIPANLSVGTRNKYSRGIIVTIGTHVLIAKREFQKDKGDIIFIYKDSELKFLIENSYIKKAVNLDINNKIDLLENNSDNKLDDKNDDLFDFSEI